ncbi:MAG: M28 family peptidase [Bacteroidota bacterium]
MILSYENGLMMKNTVFLACLFVVFSTSSQDKQAIKYAKTINQEDLKSHLTILSSDEFEGRETGKKGQKMAAEYIARQFEKFGLETPVNDSYFQKFNLFESSISSVYFKKGNEKREGFSDFVYYSSAETRGEEYVTIFMSDHEDQMIEDYKGKYIAYVSESLRGLQPRMNRAKDAGAKGFIVLLTSEDEFVSVASRFGSFLQRSTLGLESRDNTSNQMIIGNKSLAEWLFDKPFDRIKEGDEQQLIFNADYLDRPIATENVLGFLRGSEKPEEIVAITAHYDHIGIIDGEIHNGADDDGSGTATVLELAQAFSIAASENSGPKRSILFMTVTGEEKGLFGSKYYTDSDPVFPLENTVANLNIDMVGRVDEKHSKSKDYIYLIGSDKLSRELHELSESVNKTYTRLKLDYTYNEENDPNRFYYRSDHYNFAKNNIPVIFYFNGTHPDYHRPSDTIEKINFSAMEKRARLVFHTGWEIANREERLKLD